MIPSKFSSILKVPLGGGDSTMILQMAVLPSATTFFKAQTYGKDSTDCAVLKKQIINLKKDVAAIRGRGMFYDEGHPMGKEVQVAFLNLCLNAITVKSEKLLDLNCDATTLPINNNTNTASNAVTNPLVLGNLISSNNAASLSNSAPSNNASTTASNIDSKKDLGLLNMVNSKTGLYVGLAVVAASLLIWKLKK